MILISVATVIAPMPVSAQDGVQNTGFDDGLQCGASFDFQSRVCTADPAADSKKIDDTISTIINIVSIVVGLVAVIMIIIGGFKYITSNGDSGAVSSAKNTILYAIVGLVVVALAQIIVRFVVGRLTNPTTTGAPGP